MLCSARELALINKYKANLSTKYTRMVNVTTYHSVCSKYKHSFC